MKLSEQDAQRFWSKVQKTNNCWLWTGSLRNGYGMFRLGPKMWSAHRLSFAIHNEENIDGLQVRHDCDNPPCVNPQHLLLGTNKQNSDDKMSRNRHMGALRNEQVMDIRSRPLTSTMVRDLADEFGVSRSLMQAVLTGERYQHLAGAREVPPQFGAYRLTKAEFDEISRRLEGYKWGMVSKLAEEFGVTPGTISHIKTGRLKYSHTDT